MILDALDECPVGKDRNILLETIKEWITMSSKYLNVLVTSRKEKDITDTLEPLIEKQVALVKGLIGADIGIHVRRCLERDGRLSKWPLDTKQEIQDILEKRADGM